MPLPLQRCSSPCLAARRLVESGTKLVSVFWDEYGLAGVIETRGAEGAQAWTSGGEHAVVRPDAAIELIDTVGAGDAFTAVAILGIISGWPLSLTLERAQRFASLIVGRRGATVDERAFYAPLLEAWELSPTVGC